jgi:tetratricopeptide (TPR) repeat protein
MIGTALLYWPAATFDFMTLDDWAYVVNNFHVNHGFNWDGLRWCFGTSYNSNWHPLTWMSHALDCQLYGLNPGGHHATSVLLHAVNSMLLFLLLRRMTRAFWRSAMVAALFAWHPLHVESVAWISERKDVLSCLFFILTIGAYVRYAEECKTQNAGRKWPYALALLFFALGLMAKPMLVTLPFVLLLLDGWPLGRMQLGTNNPNLNPSPNPNPKNISNPPEGKAAGRRGTRFLLMEKAPFFCLSGVCCVLTIQAQYQGRAIQPLASESLQSRLSNALVSYVQYLARMIWPENVSVIHILDKNLPWWEPAAAGVFLAAVSVVAARHWKTRPWFLAGWLWYLGTLVPVIGLVQVGEQTLADRYTYIPCIGLFVLVCWGACDLVRGWRHGPAILGGLAWAALAACALLAGNQLQYWRNGGTLFAHNLEADPDNYIALNCHAAYLVSTRQLDRARAECEKSLRLNPNNELTHGILGEVLLRQEKYGEAASELAAALRINPAANDARRFYAMALLEQNLPAESARQFALVLAADPKVPDAHCGLGQALAKLGKPDEACAQFTEAVRLAPEYSIARLQLAVALARQGKTAGAISQYRLAKNVPPSVPDSAVMNNLAWILATSPLPELRDGAQAVKLAARACELDHNQQPLLLGTLAAADAEAGRFDEAVAAAQQAHDLALTLAGRARDPAEEKIAKDLAARNLELLEIYRSRQPYHEK